MLVSPGLLQSINRIYLLFGMYLDLCEAAPVSCLPIGLALVFKI